MEGLLCTLSQPATRAGGRTSRHNSFWCIAVLTVCIGAISVCNPISVRPAHSDAVLGAGADVTVTINAESDLGRVPPGAVGWGAMWKRAMLWPAPPADFDDASHAAYIRDLGERLRPVVEAGDMRNISWPWGVSFSTWGVNWENSAGRWSTRTADCARILGRGSGWCEKAIVGVGDLMALADTWQLEAITVSVPLAVIDGGHTRWGPNFFDQSFPPDVIEKIAAHARRLVDHLKAQPAWNSLQRIYLAAGCEWRHYKLRNPSPAVLTYAALIRRLREVISEEKVIIVASASDSADIPGIPQIQAATWNEYLYRELSGIPGVALDLHRYRGNEGAAAGPGNTTPLTPGNVDVLLSTGLRQRGYLRVMPQHWRGTGAPARTVLLENAIHGYLADHSTHSDEPRPWAVSLAHADLTREALRSGSLTFLGWTWFPETLPGEWPHGALDRAGGLQPHAAAQAFLSRYHRGRIIETQWDSERSLRGNATINRQGVVRLYGGNFSRNPVSLGLTVQGADIAGVRVEFMEESGTSHADWDGRNPLEVSAMTLYRIRMQR